MNYSNYYTGLDDIPLHNWMKCMEGEINFVRKAENGTNEDDMKVWETIFVRYRDWETDRKSTRLNSSHRL